MPKTPPYRIETERLVIRCWQPSDAPLLKAAADANKEHLLPSMPWAKFEPQTIDEKVELCRTFRAKFDRGEDYIYGIFDRDESRVLGGTGLHTRQGPSCLEIGYWVAVDMVGQGIATEVVMALSRICLEYCGYDHVEIRCDPKNLPSQAIPRKLGFTHEATLRRRIPDHLEEGNWLDVMTWSLFQTEYPDWKHRGYPLRAWDAAGMQVI